MTEQKTDVLVDRCDGYYSWDIAELAIPKAFEDAKEFLDHMRKEAAENGTMEFRLAEQHKQFIPVLRYLGYTIAHDASGITVYSR